MSLKEWKRHLRMEVQAFQTVIIPPGDLAKTIKHPCGLLPAIFPDIPEDTTPLVQSHCFAHPQPSARLISSAPNCLFPNERSQTNPQEFASSLVKEDVVPRAKHTGRHRISSWRARALTGRSSGSGPGVFRMSHFSSQAKFSRGFWGKDPGATVGIPTDSKSCPPGGQGHMGRSQGARAEAVTAIRRGASCPKVTKHPPEAGINPGLQEIATL